MALVCLLPIPCIAFYMIRFRLSSKWVITQRSVKLNQYLIPFLFIGTEEYTFLMLKSLFLILFLADKAVANSICFSLTTYIPIVFLFTNLYISSSFRNPFCKEFFFVKCCVPRTHITMCRSSNGVF